MKKVNFATLFWAIALVVFSSTFSSCTKNAETPDYAAAVAGTYTGSVFSAATGAVVRSNYVFTIVRTNSQEIEINDNSGTAPLKAFVSKTATTTSGDAYLGFINAGQSITFINFVELTKISGITQLMQTIPDLVGTYNIVYDVKGKSIIIGINQGGVKGAIVATK